MTVPFLRLAHLSDLHFSKVTWNPTQFFCKRWLGNLNLLLSRKRHFTPKYLHCLKSVFEELKVNAVVITGDLSSTSLDQEFELAKAFIDQLKANGIQVFAIPGNHDHYTKRAYQTKRFYTFFDSIYPSSSHLPYDLKEDGLAATYLRDNWWLFSLDTALATALLLSSGCFSEKLEKTLEEALQAIPSSHQVILMNHFPLFSSESARKELVRKEALQALLERFPKVRLYLNGHTHRHTVADLRASNLPIFLDSGSTTQRNQGTWNLIDLYPTKCLIKVFKRSKKEASDHWESSTEHTFDW